MRIAAAPASRFHLFLLAGIFAVSLSAAEDRPGKALDPGIAAAVDRAAAEVLAATGAPGASVAVVRDGAIAYVKAYGLARLEPPVPATPAMRWAVGSVSKQFTATALALLAADGRLGLDDRVAKFFPDLTRAGEISVRQLLSHTAGLRDYWPQDYVPPSMLEPISREEMLARWARQDLDFEPGTRFQYSNTGYAVAGAIAEKAGGKPLMDFLGERIFTPLGMASVTDVDRGPLGPQDPQGYSRYGLGPVRPAPKEGRGWLFAAGQLAMTAEDLARWDIALLEGSIPGRAAFREISREILLDNGAGTGYGLGIAPGLVGGRHVLDHGGEVSGFTAMNRLYPEERAAVVVLANLDASDAVESIADRIADALFVDETHGGRGALERVTRVLEDLRKGRIDRSLFTENANAYFTEAVLADFKEGLKRLGSPRTLTRTRWGLRGGLMTRVYRAEFAKTTLQVVTRTAADGRFEQVTVAVE